ncbi:very-short-patch-repair endonuclease [Paenibacillus castaneae]|uniref:helix-turn-helix domain-containing protein n=1 Tax=Paenibacillus castaneae TaxID=474957 RepID=UPI000C998EE0|nr:helix-turn-helix domain-containing protein [Paenibacillus castaneae]NIK77994.1 very-short-patch-repair endonuclease [Paenibacillus castaneae]
MHPNLISFIERFEREAALSSSYRSKLDISSISFLEQVWGPAFDHNYDGLRAEHPFVDHKGGQRFADFVYIKNGMRLVVEIDGFTTHARNISPAEFNDHLIRQNDLVLSGWIVLRFSAWQVKNHSQKCMFQLKQAIGHWWALTYSGESTKPTKLWEIRKQLLIQLAMRRDGKLKPSEVAREFQISNRTAIDWLQRFEQEGILRGQASKHRTTSYLLSSYNQS